eukprot:4491021-Heterocapsa_arctica.AAC.1
MGYRCLETHTHLHNERGTALPALAWLGLALPGGQARLSRKYSWGGPLPEAVSKIEIGFQSIRKASRSGSPPCRVSA